MKSDRRSDKPHATSQDVKRILSASPRPLTERERKERTSFYEGSSHNATPVEPGGNHGPARG
jgi:hypothetical protein